MTGEGEEEFLLKWHDHHTSFFLLMEELVTREQLTDVTLSCGDMILNAHSLMLSVCSPYFRSLLSENQHKEKHHIIHLNGVSGRLMQQLLVYMYRGEISIAQEDLGPLIETARCLQIKGLSMANSDVDSSKLPSKKRSSSQTIEYPLSVMKPKERKIVKKSSPVKVVSTAPVSPKLEIKSAVEEEYIKEDDDYIEYPEYRVTSEFIGTKDLSGEGAEIGYSKMGKTGSQSNMVTLPLLPKPLSILKTAETRTYLSKLIWLGNGGKRPQYGNPDTKPQWWPQHVLPWEEMKKMGGRKSQELSHINYTEILKQCLAAGYEYFGYDPATYYSSDPPEIQMSDLSYTAMDENNYEEFNSSSQQSLAITHTSSVTSMDVEPSASDNATAATSDENSSCDPEPALEIDLERTPTNTGSDSRSSMSTNRRCEKDHILCK